MRWTFGSDFSPLPSSEKVVNRSLAARHSLWIGPVAEEFMKRLAMVMLFALSAAAFAQDSNAQATPGAEKFSRRTNIDAINYSDIYCSGFVSSQKYSRANHVTGGLTSPHSTRFAEREYVYLAGGGYSVGSVYSVLREMKDANKFEIFPGQTKM